MRLKFSSLLSFLFIFQSLAIIAQEKWTPARLTLTTPWTSAVSPEKTLPEYPRPQMTRPEWRSLNGLWDFSLYDTETKKILKQSKILVPYPVESALSGVGMRVEPNFVMEYHREIVIPEKWKDRRILLHFGAVDWAAEVSVNGKKAGEHEGGYDPFSVDITDYLIGAGAQDISVRVTDPTDAGGQAVGKQRLRPHGIWYTAASGIWQSVWMEPVSSAYISSYRVEPDVDGGRIIARVETVGAMKGLKIMASIQQEGAKLSHAFGRAGAPLLLAVNDVRLWSPEDPYLYGLEISIQDAAGKVLDKVDGYFGMRKISLGKDENGFTRLMLNNQAYFQLGVLDQGFWPDGLYTAPSEAAMIFDLESMKAMGFNMIRKHVKVEPERWYYLCDKMGLLVWQDMPNAANVSAEDRQQFRWELKALVDARFNHPSIVIWTPFNEGWGQHDTEFYVEKLKEWDPTRLVINASGWTDEGVGDVTDVHDYPGPSAPNPEEARASVLGEFGGLGLNVRGHQWADGGWGYQLISSPEVLLERYEDIYRELLPLEARAGLSAAVYTQLSDIETENNGLITYDRRLIKMDTALVRLAHAGYLPPKPTNQALIFDKKISVPLSCIRPGARIQYAIEEKGSEPVWKDYTEPLLFKKAASILCRAKWDDGAESRTQRYAIAKVKPLSASKAPKNAMPGLSVKLYDGSWDKLPDFSALSPSVMASVAEPTVDGLGKQEDFAALYEAWIEIPKTGVYTFYLSSDDGSRLSVSGRKLIEDDGIHGIRKLKAGAVLTKGRHPIRLEYFQKKGGLGLELQIVGETGEAVSPKWVHIAEK